MDSAAVCDADPLASDIRRYRARFCKSLSNSKTNPLPPTAVLLTKLSRDHYLPLALSLICANVRLSQGSTIRFSEKLDQNVPPQNHFRWSPIFTDQRRGLRLHSRPSQTHHQVPRTRTNPGRRAINSRGQRD